MAAQGGDLGDESVHGESKCEGKGALFTLGRMCSCGETVEGDLCRS